jgi:hypothetical protein
MKTFLLLAVLFLFISPFAFVQAQFIPQAAVGIKGGMSFSRYAFSPTQTQDLTMGYTGGLVYKYISQPSLGVQLELNYVQRGWIERIDSTQTYRRDLDFIEIPFMTHVAIGKKNTAFMANFGPSVAYLVSDGDSIKSISDVEGNNYFNKEIENPFQFGLVLGLGVIQKTKLGIFQIEGRMTQSLSNIISSRQGLLSAKNTNVTVTVSCLVNFKAKRKPVNEALSIVSHHDK